MAFFRSTASLLALASATLLTGACTSSTPTGVVAGVTTQMQIPRDVKFIRLMAKSGSNFVLNEIYMVKDGTVKLPGTLTFAPADGKGRGQSITITVLGYSEDPSGSIIDETQEGRVSLKEPKAPRILRRTVLGYDEGRVAYLPVNLSYSCLGVPCEGAALTCIAGRCASDAVDVTTLPSFVEGLFEDTATGCFDATTCLSLAMPARLANVPADSGASGMSSLDRCTFTVPDKDPQGRSISVPAGTPLNVRVVYGNAPGAGSIPRAEVLNLGPDGFSIPDPTKPGVIRLASGLCEKDGALPDGSNLVSEVYIAPAAVCLNGDCSARLPTCETKLPSQSLCTRDIEKTGPKGTGGEDCDETVLEPAPSVLGLLVDRRDTMRGPLKSNAFATLLGLPMSGTLLRNTKIAVAFTPSRETGDVCASSASTALFRDPSTFDASGGDQSKLVFGTDWLPARETSTKFAELVDVKKPGGEDPAILLGPSYPFGTQEYALNYETFLAQHPAAFDVALASTPLALGGFYAAIQAPLANNRAVKGALFVLGTRDFTGTCSSVTSATESARLARAAGIDTYVLVLPDSNPSAPVAAFRTSADALANAGGTSYYNASTRVPSDDTATGLAAFTAASIDVSTCTYDGAPAAGTALSYLGLTGARVTLASNDSCAGGVGWQKDGTRARLCETSCKDYRDVVRARGLTSSLAASPLNDVPVVYRTGCSD